MSDILYKAANVRVQKARNNADARACAWIHALMLMPRCSVSDKGIERIRNIKADSVYELGCLLRDVDVLRDVTLTKGNDVWDSALRVSPVVVETPWYYGMNETDWRGFIEVHGRERLRDSRWSYVIVGQDDRREAFRIMNSRGIGWGQLGRAWIRCAEMEMLLSVPESQAVRFTALVKL